MHQKTKVLLPRKLQNFKCDFEPETYGQIFQIQVHNRLGAIGIS